MFAKYNNDIYFIQESIGEFHVLVKPSESWNEKIIVNRANCTELDFPLDDNYPQSLHELMIMHQPTENHYISQILEQHHNFVWRFTYHGTKRRVRRIVKLFEDGFLAINGDDEYRHFKYADITDNCGIMLDRLFD